KTAKSFAIELFNHSSSQAKGLKRVPRIVISPERVMPGEVGSTPDGFVERSPLDPFLFLKVEGIDQTSDMMVDISLITNTAAQSRVLQAILGKALGHRRNIPYLGNPYGDTFFTRNLNCYTLSDTLEGISERIYTYEIKDLYLSEG